MKLRHLVAVAAPAIAPALLLACSSSGGGATSAHPGGVDSGFGPEAGPALGEAGPSDASGADAGEADAGETSAAAGSDSPSCQAGGLGLTNCGPDGGDSCCASFEVQGGTFYRTYGSAADGGATGLADPATVSDFRLDKYVIDVGRFRQYVAYLADGGAPPAEGSGKHTHLNEGMGLVNSGSDAGVTYETGWSAAWNSNIPAGANAAADWNIALSSCTENGGVDNTWTPAPAGMERLPLDCLTWYDAYAFCIWDGGFLPSEAEWGYAAAAGSQQRHYPWGATAPGDNFQYEIHGDSAGDCDYPGPGLQPCTGVGNFAPVGTAILGAGLWGQLDLLGEEFEWNLDYAANYVDPCADCAYLSPAADRIMRGIGAGGAGFTSSSRFAGAPIEGTVGNEVGARCARTP